MFITGALVLSVLMLAAEKHQATAFAPVRGHANPTAFDLTSRCLDWNRSHLIRLSSVCLSTIFLLATYLCAVLLYITLELP